MSRVFSELGSCSKALFAWSNDFLASYRPAGFVFAVTPLLAASYSALASTSSFGGSTVAHASPNAGNAKNEMFRIARIMTISFVDRCNTTGSLMALLDELDLLGRALCFRLKRRSPGKGDRQLGVGLRAKLHPVRPLLVAVLEEDLCLLHLILCQLELKGGLGNSGSAELLGSPNGGFRRRESLRGDGCAGAAPQRDEDGQ